MKDTQIYMPIWAENYISSFVSPLFNTSRSDGSQSKSTKLQF